MARTKPLTPTTSRTWGPLPAPAGEFARRGPTSPLGEGRAEFPHGRACDDFSLSRAPGFLLPPTSLQQLQFFQRAWPVLLHQARQGAVSKQLVTGLAVRAVV